jgi:hypothetical protein
MSSSMNGHNSLIVPGCRWGVGHRGPSHRPTGQAGIHGYTGVHMFIIESVNEERRVDNKISLTSRDDDLTNNSFCCGRRSSIALPGAEGLSIP